MNDSSENTLHFLDYWRVIKLRWVIILIVFLLVTTVAAVTCYFLPREYYSKVTMEVKPDNTGLRVFGSETAISGSGMPSNRLSSTQFQIIMSKEVLYPVIDELKLTELWGGGQKLAKEQVFFLLLRKLNGSREIRNTDMIEIGVYSTNPQEAADIANTIARVYQAKRRQDQRDLLKESLSEVENEVNKARRKMEEAQDTMQKKAAEDGIVDLNPDGIEPVQTSELELLRKHEAEFNEAQTRTTELRVQAEQVEKLKPEELMTALNMLNIQDSTVAKILPVYQDAVVEETRLLNGGYGERHPKVSALRAQKEVWARQLTEQINTLRATLAIRLKVSEASLAAAQERMDSSRAAYTGARTMTVGYTTAKAAYINAKRLFEAAQSGLDTKRMQMEMSVYPANIWEHAEPATSIARPNIPAYMSLAMGVGLVIGIGLAFFLEYLDTSVKTLDEVERFLNTPVLAVIPKGISYLVNNPGDTPDAEAYRILQTNLEFNRKDPNANTVTLVSGGLGEGKSTTLNNLSYTYAKGGYNVLVVDADMRRASQHTLFGLSNKVGLTDVLLGREKLEDAVQATKVPNLSLLAAGKMPEDSMGILNSSQMTDLIHKVKGTYDIVFFDSPPILGLSDASILARDIDITIMVVQYRRFPRSMLMRVKQAVLHVGGNLLGAVLNNVDIKRDSNYQYYTQYYDYYGSTRGDKAKAEAVAANGTKSSQDEY